MKRVPKVAYMLEFKLEALRRVRSGEAVRKIAREFGVPEQSIRNWVKAQVEGKLGSADGKRITPEQMKISRLRAENARLKMEMEIVKKPGQRAKREFLQQSEERTRAWDSL
jgi:transposase